MSSDQLARVYGCAWCHCGPPVPGGLPYYRYAEVNGSAVVLPADPGQWARTHGICPAHLRVVEGEVHLAGLALGALGALPDRGAASRSVTG